MQPGIYYVLDQKMKVYNGDFEKIMQENENPLDKSSFLKTMSCSLKTSMSTATKASNSATLHSAVAATTTNGPPNTTDEVFDAISMIVNNNNVLIEKDFIESIKLIVRQSEQIRKRRLDLSIFVCRVILFLFLAFMMMFFIGFFYTLNSISNEFRIKNLYDSNNGLEKAIAQ